MSDVMILGSLLHLLSGKCRHCGCSGDSCSIGGGEKCYWMTTEVPNTLCSAPGCLMKEKYRKQDEERAAKRKAERDERAARIPSWMRARKAANQRNAQRRKQTKAKGRAA